MLGSKIIYNTRGIRNNNPGNLRKGCKWLGLSPVQTDKDFCQFKTMEYGIRALLITLRTYYIKYGCNTVRKIISRYAPPNENLTDSYIKFICEKGGFLPDEWISLNSVLRFISGWIMYYESKLSLYTYEIELISGEFNLL